MSLLTTATLIVHVLAGVLALLAGFGAIVTSKGGSRHNSAGKLYVATMVVVVTTAVPLALWIGSWFLLAVAIFSGYLVLAGYRIVTRRRRKLPEPGIADYTLHGTMGVTSLAMITSGGWQLLVGLDGLAPVLVVFGTIGGLLALRESTQFRRSATERMPWFERHLVFMGGGYIATVTAAITVNLSMIPPLVRWIGPTAIGVPLLVYALRVYRPRFGQVGE